MIKKTNKKKKKKKKKKEKIALFQSFPKYQGNFFFNDINPQR